MFCGLGLPVTQFYKLAVDYDEPWKKKPTEPRYIPLQAREGDFAIFLAKDAVAFRFEDFEVEGYQPAAHIKAPVAV